MGDLTAVIDATVFSSGDSVETDKCESLIHFFSLHYRFSALSVYSGQEVEVSQQRLPFIRTPGSLHTRSHGPLTHAHRAR